MEALESLLSFLHRAEILLFFTFIGGVAAASLPLAALRVVRYAAYVLIAHWSALVVTGLLETGGRWGPERGAHSFLTHVMFIGIQVVAPAAAGMLLQRAVTTRRWRPFAAILLPAGVFLFTYASGYTGYMGAGPEPISPADQIRFYVLHTLTPCLLGASLWGWAVFFKREERRLRRSDGGVPP